MKKLVALWKTTWQFLETSTMARKMTQKTAAHTLWIWDPCSITSMAQSLTITGTDPEAQEGVAPCLWSPDKEQNELRHF